MKIIVPILCGIVMIPSASAALTFGKYFTGSNSTANQADTSALDHMESFSLNIRKGDGASSNGMGNSNSTVTYGNVAGGTGNYWYAISTYGSDGGVGNINDPYAAKAGFNFSLTPEQGGTVSLTSLSFDYASAFTSEYAGDFYLAVKILYRIGGTGSWTTVTGPDRIVSENPLRAGWQTSSVSGSPYQYYRDLSGVGALQDVGEQLEISIIFATQGSYNSQRYAFSNLELTGEVTAAPIPESSSALLGLAGLAGCAFRRRR